MAIADRINEMYTHVGDVYDTITNVDLPTNKNIQNIPQTIKDSYLEIMNNGIDRIWNNWEKVTGEGTSLTLNNTYQAPMRNNLKGNTSQTGTPTPTSPIPVNVVSGDNTITISNQGGTDSNTYNIDLPVENLFDKSNANTLNCLLNGTNGSIANYNRAKSLYIPIQSSKTYTISKVLSARFVVGTCVSTPANGVTCNVYRANNTGTSITITSGASDKFLCVFYYLSGTDTLTEQQILDSIQIEVGSKANTFVPYGTTPIELCKIGNYQDYFAKSDGTNLFDKDNVNLLDKMYIGSTGTIASDNVCKTIYIQAQPSTQYTISKTKSARFRVGTFTSTPQLNSTASNVITDNDNTKITITTGANDIYLAVWLYNSGADTKTYQEIIDSIQIELGSSATPWQPYGVGKWYLHKEIGKVVLNGSESWEIASNANLSAFLNRNIMQDNSLTNLNGYCNYYSVFASEGWGVMPNNSIIIGRDTRHQILIRNDSITTVTDFQTWLSTNNTTFYYLLNTPTNTEITDTTLINQLEEFYQAQSKNNQTNISQVNNDLGFIINASALKKG